MRQKERVLFNHITELFRDLYGRPEHKGSPECGKYHGAFNNNRYHALELLKLRDRFNIEICIETGTQFGRTCKFLAKTFKTVHTIEINDHGFERSWGYMPSHYQFARDQLKEYKNVTLHLGSSPEVLDRILPQLVTTTRCPILFYLDAHNVSPAAGPIGTAALDELKMIARYCRDNCVVVLDDIYNPNVPHPYDSYNGIRFDHSFVKESLEQVFSSYMNYYSSKIDNIFSDVPKSERGGSHHLVKRSMLIVYPAKLVRYPGFEKLRCMLHGLNERVYFPQLHKWRSTWVRRAKMAWKTVHGEPIAKWPMLLRTLWLGRRSRQQMNAAGQDQS